MVTTPSLKNVCYIFPPRALVYIVTIILDRHFKDAIPTHIFKISTSYILGVHK